MSLLCLQMFAVLKERIFAPTCYPVQSVLYPSIGGIISCNLQRSHRIGVKKLMLVSIIVANNAIVIYSEKHMLL